MNCDEIETLISGYLDDELTQQEAQRVSNHLEDCEHCQAIYQQLANVKKQMKHLSYPKSDLDLLTELETDPTASQARNFGWILLILGTVIVALIVLIVFVTDPQTPFGAKLLTAVITFGVAGLFISVVRQRIIASKTDKYKKVKL